MPAAETEPISGNVIVPSGSTVTVRVSSGSAPDSICTSSPTLSL
jgi:hypothetical protein